jgi:PIN domain nuclease of toxin-antitoxin system
VSAHRVESVLSYPEPLRAQPRRRSPHVFFDDLFSNPSYQPLSLSPALVIDADDLGFTRDPFDALICAVARDVGLPLVTRDAAIAGSGVVPVIW